MIVTEELRAQATLYGGLALLALFVGLLGWNAILRHEVRALKAEARPLRSAAKESERNAEGYRTALQQCENEKLANKKANADALLAVAKAATSAAQKQGQFQTLLDHPPAGCDAVLAEHLCPALAHY